MIRFLLATRAATRPVLPRRFRQEPASGPGAELLAGLLVVLAAQTGGSERPLTSFLVLEDVGDSGRAPLFRDPVELALAEGTFVAPAEGDGVAVGGEVREWEARPAGEDGVLRLRGGYAFAAVASPEERVWMLRAAGHRSVVVNGEPRAGDVYQLGITAVPVLLREGANEFLFQGGRGRLSAKLVEPPAELFFAAEDRTVPDVVRGEGGVLLAGVLVTNATTEWQRGLAVEARTEAGVRRTELPPVPPLARYKAPVEFAAPADPEGAAVAVDLVLHDARGGAPHATRLELAVRAATEKHQRTFRSAIDGSVQYYAVTPPSGEIREPLALFLSLHGAGVEATNQAYAYAPKEDGIVVAPTNRRPYGFDWEDWGRLDALEVLAEARARWPTDARRTYLTGHSMGGHGTWSLGALFPGEFAALAPSAGWRDFGSYAGSSASGEPGDVAALLLRAARASETLLLEDNYRLPGIYVLHGDQDDNVPVEQARFMRRRLAEFHTNFAYHERRGAGHWWGNECMDWPPLFAFLRETVLPAAEELRDLRFVTVNPAIASRCHWLEIHTQEESLEPSSLHVTLDPDARRVAVATGNVRRFALDLSFLSEGPVQVSVDGEELAALPRSGELLRFEKPEGRAWRRVESFPAAEKSPARAGPFKDAFRRRMQFVAGTGGTAAENAWALAKARYDAETFWYRGNGAVQVLLDTEFSPAAEPDRNVILYGNADTHRSWHELLADSPVQVRRDAVTVGEQRFEGEDLGCLFLRPRAGSDGACVAVVAGTGLPGCRSLNQLPYFVSGVGYPDWIVLRTGFLEHGTAGVPAAGFFAPDWSLGGR